MAQTSSTDTSLLFVIKLHSPLALGGCERLAITRFFSISLTLTCENILNKA